VAQQSRTFGANQQTKANKPDQRKGRCTRLEGPRRQVWLASVLSI
jgi:hypothetical protein